MEEVHYLIPDKLKIIQNDRFFKFGTDSVLLANFSRIKKGDLVVDFGTGSGIIPLLLAFKQQPSRIIGIELQAELAEMARRSVEMNHLEEIIEIKTGDLKQIEEFTAPGRVDVVTSNPPYMPVEAGKITMGKEKAIARHEIHASFGDVASSASRILRFGGTFYLVHRTWRLAEVMAELKKVNLEPKQLRLVQSRWNKAPDMFLLKAKKGAKPGLRIDPVLIVYQGESSHYTSELKKIYGED